MLPPGFPLKLGTKSLVLTLERVQKGLTGTYLLLPGPCQTPRHCSIRHCSSWFPAADTNEKSISCVLTGNASSASQERRADVSIAFKITNKLISGPVCSPGNEKEKGCGERWNLKFSRQVKVSSSCLPQCIVRFVPHRLSQVIPSLP